MTEPSLEAADRALAAWGLAGAELAPLGGGLIHGTWLVVRGSERAVLQRVNPIFDPRIHENIAAVTARLASRGEPTLTLVPTLDGQLWLDRGGIFRVYEYVEGVTHAVVGSRAQAFTAGRRLGAFHAALEGLDHEFVGMRLGVHDTPRHLATLRDAVSQRSGHRLHSAVSSLAAAIATASSALSPLPALLPRIGHGDPKLANVLFDLNSPDEALCLVDLDTVGPLHLGHELGDMWRSWCNRASEDDVAARVDLEVMEASWAGYCEGWGRPMSPLEREAAWLGVEWISLELAARFAADALLECYFGWDATRFATRGDHNLERARGQWALHREMVATRPARRELLALGGR